MSPFASSHPETVICGIRFSCLDRPGAADWLIDRAKNASGGYACVTGAHGIVVASEDEEFKRILNAASMNTLDGQPIAWIARWRGNRVERVTGRELVWDVVAQDSQGEVLHIFFGATSDTTAKVEAALRARNSKCRVATYNPPFGPISDELLDRFCREYCGGGPAIVWVGLSTPKQERVAVRLSARLAGTPVVAVGAAFDFVAGLKPLAPKLVTLLCLEWLFRLLSEPRRLFARYAYVVPKFLFLVLKDQRAALFSHS